MTRRDYKSCKVYISSYLLELLTMFLPYFFQYIQMIPLLNNILVITNNYKHIQVSATVSDTRAATPYKHYDNYPVTYHNDDGTNKHGWQS